MQPRRNSVNFAFVNRSAAAVPLLAILSVLSLTVAQDAQAQTFSVLHYFTGGLDGNDPYAGVTVGPSGVLYGTAADGGTYGMGTVFKLKQVNSTWVASPLYEFTGAGGGSDPLGAVVIGPNGALYGTTFGNIETFGTVFELTPPPTFCRSVLCFWNENVLHTFTGTSGGAGPQVENLVFDSAGNIYGTTQGGGAYDSGVTFELTPSGGGYTESILHSFGSGTDGRNPLAGVVFDTAGNVYGTTERGGTGSLELCHGSCGTVYQLVPSNGGWVENVLVNFDVTNGQTPYGSLIIDGSSGNLYGTTALGGQNGGGVVYELTPSGGGFNYSVLYSFTSCGSRGGLAADAAGNFFGVCYSGGANQDGWIFELTNCSQGCNLVDLHDFSGSDGMNPNGSPVLDASGNLYGTTGAGGTGCNQGCGVVWEIAGVGAPREN